MLTAVPPIIADILFYALSAIALASAIGVVACRNIIRSAVCLLFSLIAVAGFYLMLNAEFLAAVQLIVYTGGILILLIFGVMLTSTSPFSRYQPKAIEVAVAVSTAVLMLTALIVVFTTAHFPASKSSTPADPTAIGQALLGDYVGLFELASVLLLVVMIGAAHLARARHAEAKKLNDQGSQS